MNPIAPTPPVLPVKQALLQLQNPQQSQNPQLAQQVQQPQLDQQPQDAQPEQQGQAQQQAQPSGIIDALNKQLQEGAQNLDQEKQSKDQQNLFTQSPQQRATISRTLGMLTPDNTKSTPAQIGKSIATNSYAGYCLQYVDDKQGNTNRQPTAFADYQSNAQQGNIAMSGKPAKGARVYFAPDGSNGGMGHVGISNGDGSFTSATDNGIKTYNIKDWMNFTGQQLIGWTKGK